MAGQIVALKFGHKGESIESQSRFSYLELSVLRHMHCNFDEFADGWACTSGRLRNSQGCNLRGPHMFVGFIFGILTRFSLWRSDKYPLGALTDGGEVQSLWNEPNDQVEKKPKRTISSTGKGRENFTEMEKEKKGMLQTIYVHKFDLG